MFTYETYGYDFCIKRSFCILYYKLGEAEVEEILQQIAVLKNLQF